MSTSLPALQLGQHRFSIEGDFIFLQWNGEFRGEDIREFLLVLERAREEHGYVFLLVDARRAGMLQPAARKAAGNSRPSEEAMSAAFFGASYTLRIIVNTVAAAYTLLSGKPPLPFYFTATEGAARQWLDTRRKARARSR
jgi:hypothetical protein